MRNMLLLRHDVICIQTNHSLKQHPITCPENLSMMSPFKHIVLSVDQERWETIVDNYKVYFTNKLPDQKSTELYTWSMQVISSRYSNLTKTLDTLFSYNHGDVIPCSSS